MSLYILDTDHLSILRRETDSAYGQLVTRLSRLPSDQWTTTIVSFQEQTQGWLAYLSRAKSPLEITFAYDELHAMQLAFTNITLLPFEHEAQGRFDLLRQQKVRIGTLDLRIACIALTREGTLLSRNLKDFQRVPGIAVEDWTT